jgi:hypothetical protein
MSSNNGDEKVFQTEGKSSPTFTSIELAMSNKPHRNSPRMDRQDQEAAQGRPRRRPRLNFFKKIACELGVQDNERTAYEYEKHTNIRTMRWRNLIENCIDLPLWEGVGVGEKK